MQVSVGLLGVVTELELEVAPADRLCERIEHWSWDEAWERFDEIAPVGGSIRTAPS